MSNDTRTAPAIDLRLYDAPMRGYGAAMSPAAPARQPLTDAEIDAMWREVTIPDRRTAEFVREFARAIERAHGIRP